MDNSKARSYIYYALGEVVLVVIGILIALQINNWNEDRKSRLLEHKLLKELLVDLQETKADLLTDIDKTLWLVAITDSLYNSLYLPEAYAGRRPYQLPMSSLIQRGKLFPKSSAYASIQSVGITIIRNVSLRNRITELYELLLPRVEGREGIVVKMRNDEFLPILKSHFDTREGNRLSIVDLGGGRRNVESWITVRELPNELKLTLKMYSIALNGQQNVYDSFLVELEELESMILAELDV